MKKNLLHQIWSFRLRGTPLTRRIGPVLGFFMILTSLGVITAPVFKATSPPWAYLGVLGVLWLLGAAAGVLLIRLWRFTVSQEAEARTMESSDKSPETPGANHDKRNGPA